MPHPRREQHIEQERRIPFGQFSHRWSRLRLALPLCRMKFRLLERPRARQGRRGTKKTLQRVLQIGEGRKIVSSGRRESNEESRSLRLGSKPASRAAETKTSSRVTPKRRQRALGHRAFVNVGLHSSALFAMLSMNSQLHGRCNWRALPMLFFFPTGCPCRRRASRSAGAPSCRQDRSRRSRRARSSRRCRT